MATAIIIPTGPPLLRYFPGAAIDEDPVDVVLPRAVFEEGVDGQYDDQSLVNKRASGYVRVFRRGNRKLYRFGYRCFREVYTDALTRLLIEALSKRVVLFTPRTLAANDPPEAAAEVEEVACRVLSDIPTTRHLTLDYAITIELEALDPVYV